ncbi:MAG TPA: rhodanese-like domain-containing protein [Thermodesulfovibrionia bacterium]|nr:rhodanese-like domain-containing protein [Thermodesulfovibrionia bacterium]
MGNRTVKVIMVAVLVLAVGAGFAFAGSWPADVVKKVEEFKLLKRDKKEMPATIEGITIITAEELKSWLDQKKKFTIIDNRPVEEFAIEHIPEAKRLDAEDLYKDPKLADAFNKEDITVNYCNGVMCWRSPAMTVMLKSLGFKNVYWFRDGVPVWAKKGFPTAEGKE